MMSVGQGFSPASQPLKGCATGEFVPVPSESPTPGARSQSTDTFSMSLFPGTRLGPYEIQSQLGAAARRNRRPDHQRVSPSLDGGKRPDIGLWQQSDSWQPSPD